jgi:hypothetical protein
MADPLGRGIEARIKHAIQNFQDLLAVGGKSGDAIEMLIHDHKMAKRLFRRFKWAKDTRIEANIIDQLLPLIKMHSRLEEEMIYPLIRKASEDAEPMDEAAEEHHVADVLIKEIESMKPGDEHYHAKVMVLFEVVEHHIDEEEHHLLPKLKRSGQDLEELGKRLAETKKAWQEQPASSTRKTKQAKPVRVKKTAGRVQIVEPVEDKPKKKLAKRVKVTNQTAVPHAGTVEVQRRSPKRIGAKVDPKSIKPSGDGSQTH